MEAPIIDRLELPDLENVDCSACKGEGYHIPGPFENPVTCERCSGYGTVEVCSGCQQHPEIKDGLEVCGCIWSDQREEVAA